MRKKAFLYKEACPICTSDGSPKCGREKTLIRGARKKEGKKGTVEHMKRGLRGNKEKGRGRG